MQVAVGECVWTYVYMYVCIHTFIFFSFQTHTRTHSHTGHAQYERAAGNEALLDFIRHVVEVQKIMNNPQIKLRADSPELNVLEGFANYCEAWRKEVEGLVGENGKVSSSFFSDEAHEDMIMCMRGLVGCVRRYCTGGKYLLPHMCSQDPIEHHFGIVKGLIRGRLTVENVEQVTRGGRFFRMFGFYGKSKKDNIGDRSRDYQKKQKKDQSKDVETMVALSKNGRTDKRRKVTYKEV